MSVSLVTQPSLENHTLSMWEVEPTPGADGSRIMRLGETRFSLARVVRYSAEIRETRHRHGRIVAMLVFGSIAALFMIGILQFSVQPRFFLAAFICFALALMSLEDVIFSRPQRLAVFDVVLDDGRRFSWSTADEAAAAAVNAMLAQRI